MDVSGVDLTGALVNLSRQSAADGLQTEVSVRMLKRAQQQMTREGEALVQLIEQAAPPPIDPRRLDTYA